MRRREAREGAQGDDVQDSAYLIRVLTVQKMLMNCYSVSGGGKKYDQGTWEVRMTQKTASFTCAIVPTVFADYRTGETIKIHKEKP